MTADENDAEPDGAKHEPSKAEDVADAESAPAFIPTFPVVGIGASAGGLDAIVSLLGRLKSDSIAYVYVQHLAPGQETPVREILGKHTPAEIVVATDGMTVEKNHFYVAPAQHEIRIDRGVLRIRPGEGSTVRLPIDTFFRSLSHDYKTAAIAIVLSGSGTDGTLGLQAIKDEGGITFVQDPTTAAQGGMPQSALDSGFGDFCSSPEEIGDELMRLSAHPYVARTEQPRIFKKEPLQRIFALLRDVFGVDFTSYKQSSIERRIERRMVLHKSESLEEYARYLEKTSVELNLLYHDLLIGVTCFFRDREPFEALKTIVFPRLLENRDPEVPMRVWVPGCSTGEEPYSIAMCLLEFLGERTGGQRIQIFGTDIDEQALERARVGIYPQNIEADVSPPRLQRFFARAEKGYQISRQIREMIVFARHNLGKDPPFSRLDFISCRNVLISLQPQLQKKIIRVFHYGLNSSGMLLLGSSETVSDDLFQLVDRKLRLYSKRNVPTHASFDVVFGGVPAGATDDRRPRPEVRSSLTAQQLADRKVLEKYSPPGVVINENMDVVQFRGRTGPYLEPTPGNATLNLLRLTRPEFLTELRTTIKKALSEALPVSSAAIRFKDASGMPMVVRIDVLPLFDASSNQKSLLVLFNDTRIKEVPEGTPSTPSDEPTSGRVQDLERELGTTKEYLQTTVEELETTNEELMSANEELQSSNEELQSTNEELSTSKEELQSTNEELSTVNDELHHRLSELSVSNDDLQNLMSGSSIISVLVGSDLRIRRFSVAAEKLLHLLAGDIGRPVSYLAGTLRVHDLEAAVTQTIGSVAPRTIRARATDGFEYDLRIVPYKTADQAIRGAVLELQNRRPARSLPLPGEIHEWADAVLSALPRSVFVLDADLRIIWANEQFLDSFLLDSRIFGRLLTDVWGSPLDAELRTFLEDAVAQRTQVTEHVVARPFTRTAPAKVRWVVTALPAVEDRPRLLLIVIEE
jgi:two-component system CheB/CheR fusion protein